MRIQRVHPELVNDYCCNIYWVAGDPGNPRDANTLVDVGSSHPGTLDAVLAGIADLPKGIGRRPVEQVVLTHAHYDHAGALAAVVERFHPVVHAFQAGPGVSHPIVDGQWLRVGSLDVRVLHTPGHSDDSICLFCPETRALFSGDTLYRISEGGGAYPACYARSLERLQALRPAVIYPGHGEPIARDAEAFIASALAGVKASTLKP